MAALYLIFPAYIFPCPDAMCRYNAIVFVPVSVKTERSLVLSSGDWIVYLYTIVIDNASVATPLFMYDFEYQDPCVAS